MANEVDSFAEYARNVGTTLLVGTAIVASLQIIKSGSFYDDLLREIDEISRVSELVRSTPETILSSFGAVMDRSKYELRMNGLDIVDNPEFAELAIQVDSDHQREWSTALIGFKPLISPDVLIKKIVGTVPIDTDHTVREVTIGIPNQKWDGLSPSFAYADGDAFYVVEDQARVGDTLVYARYPRLWGAPSTLAQFKEFWSVMQAGFDLRSVDGPEEMGTATISERVIRSDLYYHREDEVAEAGIHYTQLGTGFFRLVSKQVIPKTDTNTGVILLGNSSEEFNYNDPAIYQLILPVEPDEYVGDRRYEFFVAAEPTTVSVRDAYPEPQNAFGYVPIYELELKLPVKKRLEHLTVSDVGGEPIDFRTDFDQRFPTVAKAGSSFLNVEYATVREMALKLRELDTGSSEILGITVPNSFLRGWGAAIIAGLQLYFLVYLRQFRQRLSTATATAGVPWSLLDKSALSRTVSVAGYILFPMAVCIGGYFTAPTGQAKWIVLTAGIASLIVGLWSLRESARVWQIVAQS